MRTQLLIFGAAVSLFMAVACSTDSVDELTPQINASENTGITPPPPPPPPPHGDSDDDKDKTKP